jgi:hypothetical protein
VPRAYPHRYRAALWKRASASNAVARIGKDYLVTERSDVARPASNDSPDTSPNQLSVGSAPPPLENDSRLLALEGQFNTISAELLALERLRHAQRKRQGAAAQESEQSTEETRLEEHACDEAVTRRIEPVLARLYPIERAIMRTPACTIAGLGVKARHAAYVMSQYWEEPIDQIDWEAQAVRLLIEAVCNVSRTPLPFRNLRDDE